MGPEDADWIDPAAGAVLAVIFWSILLIMILVSLRRAKVRRDRLQRFREDVGRREAYIQRELDKENDDVQ